MDKQRSDYFVGDISESIKLGSTEYELIEL